MSTFINSNGIKRHIKQKYGKQVSKVLLDHLERYMAHKVERAAKYSIGKRVKLDDFMVANGINL